MPARWRFAAWAAVVLLHAVLVFRVLNWQAPRSVPHNPAGAGHSVQWVPLPSLPLGPLSVAQGPRHRAPQLPLPLVQLGPAAPPELAVAPAPAAPVADPGLIERLRGGAGAADRAARAGASANSLDAPLQANRFERALGSAYTGGLGYGVNSVYTSPDGVSITRVTRGAQTLCFTSDTVNHAPSFRDGDAGNVTARHARQINCPPAEPPQRR